jgi:Arc-like DNA binding domain
MSGTEREQMPMARKATDTVNLRVRMPEGIRKRLAVEAEGSRRSLNSEIVWRLGQSLGEEELVQEHESSEERMRKMMDEIVERISARLTAERNQ